MSQRKEVFLTGSGGQGIQLMAEVLGLALTSAGFQVSSASAYGPEVRGGDSSCKVVILEYRDAPTEIMEADILLVMSQSTYEKSLEEVSFKKEALVLYDPILVKPEPEKGDQKQYYAIPASEIASELKDRRVANMAMLGGLVRIIGLISLDDIIQALKKKKKYSEANQKALEEGYKRIHLLDK